MTYRKLAIISGIKEAEKKYGTDYKAALEEVLGEMFDFCYDHPELERVYRSWKVKQEMGIDRIRVERTRIM